MSTPTMLLLLERDEHVARELTTLLAGDAATAALDVVVVPSVAAATQSRPTGSPDCLVVPLHADGDADDAVVREMRAAIGDLPLVGLVISGGLARGLLAIRHGADDFVLVDETTSGKLSRAVSCVLERSRYRFERDSARANGLDAVPGLTDGLLILDSAGCVASMNPTAARILEVEPDELIGRPMTHFSASLSRPDGTAIPDAERPSNLTLTSGLPVAATTVGIRDDLGELRWLEVAGDPILTAEGCVEHVLLSVHDITAQVACEAAEHFHSELLLAIGQAVVVTDPEDVIVSWNGAAEQMYGWSAAEAIGQRARRLMPPESPDQAAEVTEAIRSRRTWTGELFVRHCDGTRICAFGTTTPVYDQRGLLTSIISVSADVTEQHRAKEVLQTLSAIVTSTADAVFSKTLDGTILSWNRGAAALYGYTEDEVIGQNVTILRPDDPGEIRTILATVAAGDTVRDHETVRRRRDGATVHVSLTVSPVYAEDGTVSGASVISRDVTEHDRLVEQLTNQTTHDALTDLPNRVLLLDRMAQALAVASRGETSIAVLIIDLDQFGDVNARHGFTVGDRVLVEVATRLTETVCPGDTVARLNGDQFALLCTATPAEATALAERVSSALEQTVDIDGLTLRPSASIGIATAPPATAQPNVLLAAGQAAMHEAQAAGRSQWRLFDASLDARVSERRQTSQDLSDALDSGQLEVHYQPVIEIRTGRFVGVEALARWLHPVRGWVPPSHFVPLAEDSGLVAALDAYVLRVACADATRLRAWGVLPEDGYLAVNVSARNVGDGGLVTRVCTEAARSRWPLERLELEVTETGLMGDRQGARTALEQLRALGVGIALDDFGTGYSSLAYLRQLPISTIKVDRVFVQHMATRSDDLAITASVIDLGRSIDVRTVAEGVETVEQLALLHRLGCIAAQGFLWSPAVSRDDLADLVRRTPGGFQPVSPAPDVRWRGGRRSARVSNEHGLHRIRKLHRDGASLATIAAALNASDFRTPTGQRWHGTSVARVIADAMANGDDARAWSSA